MKRVLVMAVAVLLGSSVGVHASDPIGIYAQLDRVGFEPNEQTPERIQLWGIFALPEEGPGYSFGPPARGYLYYALVPGKEDLCRREWTELKNSAGSGQCVAFGTRYQAKSLVHKTSEEPRTPEPYPLAYGVFKIRDTNIVARNLRSLPVPLSPIEGQQVRAGAVMLRARNIQDKERGSILYVFEFENGAGDKETSPPVRAGDQETTWSPTKPVQAGGKYTWRVWATSGNWKGPVSTTTFLGKAVP